MIQPFVPCRERYAEQLGLSLAKGQEHQTAGRR
jgi:hypothetical protein